MQFQGYQQAYDSAADPTCHWGTKAHSKVSREGGKKAPSFASTSAFHEGEFLLALRWGREVQYLSETLEEN